jgi:hypothetical protein
MTSSPVKAFAKLADVYGVKPSRLQNWAPKIPQGRKLKTGAFVVLHKNKHCRSIDARQEYLRVESPKVDLLLTPAQPFKANLLSAQQKPKKRSSLAYS